MTRTDKYLMAVLVVICGITGMGCKQQRTPCLTSKAAPLTLETMHITYAGDTAFVDTALATAVFVALTNTRDTGLEYLQQQSVFNISLSPDTNYCRWLFTSDTSAGNRNFDTLTFFYRRDLQFLSNACGYTYFYSLDSVHVTHYSLLTPQFVIDSVSISNASVTNNANTTKNLRIYIHPDF